MPYPSRITRASTRGRSRRKVTPLRSVDRIEPIEPIEESDDLEVNLVPSVESSVKLKKPQLPALEDMLDKLLVLTQRWEKITALVALATTNLTGNKNLGTLLEIVARGRNEISTGASQDFDSTQTRSSLGGLGNINIPELLNLAESLLKTGQQDIQGKEDSTEPLTDQSPETDAESEPSESTEPIAPEAPPADSEADAEPPLAEAEPDEPADQPYDGDIDGFDESEEDSEPNSID